MSRIIALFLSLFIFCTVNSFANIEKSNSPIKFDSAPLNLEEIINFSGKIFSGICTNIEEIEKDPQSNLHVTKYTFKVTEGIKGITDESEVTFKQWAEVSREVAYKKGGKYIAFLYPESKLGLTSTVGFLQGQFTVTKGLDNNEYIKNNLNNTGLAQNLKTKKNILITRDRSLNDYIHKQSKEGNSINYKEFIKATRYLIEK